MVPSGFRGSRPFCQVRAELLRTLLGKDLISQDIVDNLLSWRHSGFSVHGDVKAHDRTTAARLGRYMIRCP